MEENIIKQECLTKENEYILNNNDGASFNTEALQVPTTIEIKTENNYEIDQPELIVPVTEPYKSFDQSEEIKLEPNIDKSFSLLNEKDAIVKLECGSEIVDTLHDDKELALVKEEDDDCQALGHVEACLEDSIDESFLCEESVQSNVANEHVPENNIIDDFNNVILHTNTNLTNGVVSQYTNSQPVEHENFQLNSITGDEPTLQEQALLAKREVRKNNKKHQNAKDYYKELSRQLKKHEKEKKALLKKKNEVNIKIDKKRVDANLSKDNYACSCGKRYKRRTLMESCLKSHEESEITVHSCMSCSKKFQSKEDLALHRKRLHSKKRYSCKFCPTEYNTQKMLLKHLTKHKKVQLMEFKVISQVVEKGEKLKCFVCNKVCDELSDLKTHVLEHKEPYNCINCNDIFKTINDLAGHMKTVHPKTKGQCVLEVLGAFLKLAKEWKCEECHVQYNSADELALHKLDLHSESKISDIDQFQCPDCRRVFTSAKSLNSHSRVHHLETKIVDCKGIICVHCRKICKDETALTSHLRLHSLDRKYPCKYCDFRFSTVSKRKEHAKIHTGDLRYVCFICEYQCSSLRRLNMHKKSPKHLSTKEYLLSCPPETVVQEPVEEFKDSISEDVKSDTESEKSVSNNESDVEVTCDICGETFNSETTMLDHKQTHPFIEFPNEDTPTRIFFK